MTKEENMSTNETCTHGRPLRWPEEIWIGQADDQWPIYAFASADAAARWLADAPADRDVYRVDGTRREAMEHVPAVAASYRAVPIVPSSLLGARVTRQDNGTVMVENEPPL